MNHKSSDGLSKVSLLPCTKRNIAALISSTLRGLLSSLQASSSAGADS